MKGPQMPRQPLTRPTTRTCRPLTSAVLPMPRIPNRPRSDSSTTTAPGSVRRTRISGVKFQTAPAEPSPSWLPMTKHESDPPLGLCQ